MPESPQQEYRDHDHRAEQAVIDYTEDPTEQNAWAAEMAVARLQRSYDHVLRRLDGTGDLPKFPVHRHNAAESPETCVVETLELLAGAHLEDRAETLAHGLAAANALGREREELTAEIGRLRQELSLARSVAWAQQHRLWGTAWFPSAWAPEHDGDDWHLPQWLTTSQMPSEQDWFEPPQ